MDEVRWSIHRVVSTSTRPFYVLLSSDGTGFHIGSLTNAAAIYDCLSLLLNHGVEGEPIADLDFHHFIPWLSVREAEEQFGVPRATLTWACRQGHIVGAEKLGNRWRFPLVTFRSWLRKRKERS